MKVTIRKLYIVFSILISLESGAQRKETNAFTDHLLYPGKENARIVSKKVLYTRKYNIIKRYREVFANGEIFINDFKLQTIEGKLTRIKYFVPSWRMYMEHDSLIAMFCSDLIFLPEFVSPDRTNLDKYVPNSNGFYTSLGIAGDKIPEDNFYFVLSRYKDFKKVYVVITGTYNLLHDGNYYTVDIIETNYKQFISTFEIADFIYKEGSVNISSILFETGSAEIKNESEKEVKFLGDFLKSDPKIKIVIGGHTDNVGDKIANQKLSENRARALKKILVETYGIEQSRIGTIGYGETQPIADNNTPDGRALNRRVEIIKAK